MAALNKKVMRLIGISNIEYYHYYIEHVRGKMFTLNIHYNLHITFIGKISVFS
jgi:hypothetical protein